MPFLPYACMVCAGNNLTFQISLFVANSWQLFIISVYFLCIYTKMVSCNSHCAMLLAAAEHLMPTQGITQPHGFTSDHTQGSTRLHMVQMVHAPP